MDVKNYGATPSTSQGYCLMTNHVHLVAVPRTVEALAKAVGRTHFRYTQYINRFHKRSGHLWQGRFYSCALDTRGFWLAMRNNGITGTVTYFRYIHT